MATKIKKWAKGVWFAILGRQNLGCKGNIKNVAFLNESGNIEIKNPV